MINLIIISFKFTPIYCIPSLCIDVSFCLSVCLYLPLLSLKTNCAIQQFYLSEVLCNIHLALTRTMTHLKILAMNLRKLKKKTFFNFHECLSPKYIQLLFVDIKKRFLRMFGVLFHKYNAIYTFLNLIVKIALNVLISGKHRVFVGCLCC